MMVVIIVCACFFFSLSACLQNDASHNLLHCVTPLHTRFGVTIYALTLELVNSQPRVRIHDLVIEFSTSCYNSLPRVRIDALALELSTSRYNSHVNFRGVIIRTVALQLIF